MLTRPPNQSSKITMAPNAGPLIATRKRNKNIQIGRQPINNMRVKFAPPVTGRRVSQLVESMEVDNTSITKSKLHLG